MMSGGGPEQSAQNGEAGFSLDVYWCVMRWGALLKAGTGVGRGFRRTDTHLPNASREFMGCFLRGEKQLSSSFHNLAQARCETAHHIHNHRALFSAERRTNISYKRYSLIRSFNY